MAEEKTICPHCGNTMGFVFGTCVDCGYNYLDKNFHHIRLYMTDMIVAGLSYEQKQFLIEEHARRTKKQVE